MNKRSIIKKTLITLALAFILYVFYSYISGAIGEFRLYYMYKQYPDRLKASNCNTRPSYDVLKAVLLEDRKALYMMLN